MTITVLVADDQEMVRAGFRMILDDAVDMEVIAEAADGATAVALAQDLRPDVCLMDVRMPHLDGLETTRRLAGPDVADPLRVVVVTTFDLDEYVHTALRNGAAGFLLKDAGPTLLLEAVRAAHRGDVLVSPSITVRLLAHFAAATSVTEFVQPAAPLTDRGGGGSPRRCARAQQRRDRRGALHLTRNRQDASFQPSEQDRRPKPCRAGGVRVAERTHERLSPFDVPYRPRRKSTPWGQ